MNGRIKLAHTRKCFKNSFQGAFEIWDGKGNDVLIFVVVYSIDLRTTASARKELIKNFHSSESFFGWEVFCQALMRRTMQPWLINLSIYRDCETVAACAPMPVSSELAPV